MKKFIVGMVLAAGGFIVGFAACELGMCSVISSATDGEERAQSILLKALNLGDTMRGVTAKN